jgi:hypothetical protein
MQTSGYVSNLVNGHCKPIIVSKKMKRFKNCFLLSFAITLISCTSETVDNTIDSKLTQLLEQKSYFELHKL